MIRKYQHIIISLLGALMITVIAATGALQRPDRWVSDLLFQTPQMVSGDIVIIGIDDRSISELGPYYSWDRNVMSSALEALGSDPDNMPAAVAIDTLFSGKTTAEADGRLVEACRKLGNVVVADSAEFGVVYNVDDSDGSYSGSYSIVSFNEPYEELKEATAQGHINAMLDRDGIMRHALLYLDREDGQRVYSMAYETAKIYLESKGDTITTPPEKSGYFYVPFSAKPRTYYDGKSLADLINGKIPADYYAGKIVMIGPYSIGLQDSYFTPVDHAQQMYGVEIQANVIQSLIDRNFRSEVPDLPQLISLFIACFVAMLIFYKSRLIISGLAFLFFLVSSGAGSVILYRSGYVTHPIWIPTGVALLFIAGVVAHYVRAAIGKNEVTKTFERYVAPSIVKEIMKEGTDELSLGGKNCEIAVLFVDVRGFTTMSERLAPEKVVLILNRYLTMASNCIEEQSGTLDKFVGDAVMAFWGAPLPQEDPVYLACRTALDIIKGAEEVSAQLKDEIGEEFQVGVGVHFGPAVVGNMGSERRMDYTAIGDTVNTASRLESNAPGGTCYISRIVADKLGDRAEVTSLGSSVKLKGKADGFEVLTLDSLKGGS